jgi:DNA-binding PucR family transcriptional regulator
MVSDCLKLSALREAKVVAGHGGLNKIVSAVSVLEYADTSLLVDGLFIGNELIISALVSIKDDVEAQCKLIRRLNEVGEVGLILYYVGIFVLCLDKQLLKVADELDFPLICMPENRFDFRYSEVISEILGIVIKDQMRETYFVTGIIDRITQLQERQQTIGAVMRMLSDRLHCTLLLANHTLEQRGFAAWPMASRWAYNDILDGYLKEQQLLPQESPVSLKINDVIVFINHISIALENEQVMYLIAVNEHHPLPVYHLKQAAEVIQIFINNWQYDFGKEDSYALIHAILEDDPPRMRRIAKALQMDVSSIHTMWVLKEIFPPGNSEFELQQRQNRNIKRAIRTKSFLLEHRKLVLVDTVGDAVVAFINNNPFYEDQDEGLEKTFMEVLRYEDQDALLVVCTSLMTTTDVRNAYMLMETCLDTCHRIYPYKRIINLHELRFAQECLSILERGEASVKSFLLPLKPLQTQEDSNELIETLSVFLLDTQYNIPQTGDRLFLHKNTVKYRINKIKQRIGYDISKMPAAYKLYLAVALNRLLR